MKSTLKATAIVLLGALGGVNRSLAATAYTNSVLSGCYGFLSHSVGISPPHRLRVSGEAYEPLRHRRPLRLPAAA
jgi:hypothetical protein